MSDMEAGIRSLGGILEKSDRMLLLWDHTYLTRLWCTYELAVLVKMAQAHPDNVVKIRIRPTWLGCLLLIVLGFAIIPMLRLALLSLNLPDVVVTPILCLLAPTAASLHLRQAAHDSAEAKHQLRGFSISEARCF